MEFFPEKGLDNISNSRAKFITRKDNKKSTIESRNKIIQKKKSLSSNSSLINMKSRDEKELAHSLSNNNSLLINEELEQKKKRKKNKKANINRKKIYSR